MDPSGGAGIHSDLGDRLGQASALWCLGQRTGDYPDAARAAAEALGISNDFGEQVGQANALSVPGIVRRQAGDCQGAASAYEAALGIYRDIGRPGR